MITLLVFWLERKYPNSGYQGEGGIYWGTVTIDVIGLIVLGSWLGVC